MNFSKCTANGPSTLVRASLVIHSMGIQGLKFMFTKFKYFQGLKMGLLKFKAFQHAYEPCSHQHCSVPCLLPICFMCSEKWTPGVYILRGPTTVTSKANRSRQKQIHSQKKQIAHGKSKSTQCFSDIFTQHTNLVWSLFIFIRNFSLPENFWFWSLLTFSISTTETRKSL